MGCIIQIKTENGFKIFETEEQAMNYIRKNNLELSTIKDKDGKEVPILVNAKDGRENYAIIRKANEIAFQKTGEVRTKMSIEGWSTVEYDKNSPFLSVSNLLKSVRRIKDGVEVRLFPEFIQHNYLNVLTQTEIIRSILNAKGIDDEEEIFETRRKIFDSIPEDKYRSAEFWYNRAKTLLNAELTQDDFARIDDFVISENESNFKMMLYGEIFHKLFEINNNHEDWSSKTIADAFYKSNIFESFVKKYSNYDQIKEPLKIIEEAKEIMSGELIYKYIDYVKSAKNSIIENIKKTTPNARIEFLTEKTIICDLNNAINGKSQVAGKIDLVVLVDGNPQIVDLKISSKPIASWADEKMKKTKYQLATYQKMLESIGVRFKNTSLRVYNIVVDKETMTPKSEENYSVTNKIDNDTVLQEDLKNIFGNIKNEENYNAQAEDSINYISNELWGTTSLKDRKKKDREAFKSEIHEYVDKKTGRPAFRYYTWTASGTKEQFRILKENENKDDVRESVLSAMIDSYEGQFSIQYETLIKNIESYLQGEITISEFKAASSTTIASRLQNIFLKYGADCSILKNKLAERNNMILIQTPVGIDVIVCDNVDQSLSYDPDDNKSTLLSNIPKAIKDSNLKSVGNVNVMRGLLVINEIINNLNCNNEFKTVGEIITVNLNTIKGYKMSHSDMQSNWDMIVAQYSDKISDNISGNITDPVAKVFYTFNKLLSTYNNFDKFGKSFVHKLTKQLSKHSNSSINDLIIESLKDDSDYKQVFKDSSEFSDDDKIFVLKQLRSQMIQEFTQFGENKRTSNEISILMDMIENALAILENRELNFEKDISKIGWSSGSLLLSLDLIPSKNARVIQRIVNDGFDKVHASFNKFNSGLRRNVEKLKNDKGFSTAEALTSGYATRIYNNLFRTDSNGELLDGDLILKNPWDTNEDLSNTEREFLKFVLFHLNKYKKGWKSIDKVDPSRLENEDFYMPLIRNKGLINRIASSKNGGLSVDNIKSWWNQNRNNMLQMKDTLEGTIEARSSAASEMRSIYNEFHNRTDLKARKEFIEKNGLESFSRDIETAMMTFIIAMESEKTFNTEIIPTIRGILYSLQTMGSISGTEMDNLRDFIEKYMKSVVYNDSIMSNEAKEVMKFVAPFKAAASAIALNFNLVNLPRELIMGTYNIIGKAMFKSYGQETFGINDYMKAWRIMHVDAFKFVKEVTKIELLNEHFHMSNMSITDVPEEATSNKTGINALFSRFAHWTVTAPDYWNRMTMFIAQMCHDGTFDAYDVVQNDDSIELVYNMAKDERFKILVEYKCNINNVPNHLVEEFNRQLSLYESMRDDMKKESGYEIFNIKKGRNNDGKDWYLPKAYTNRQRDSLKSFADLTFGYYDKEVKAEFFKTAVGGVFKQFMAYMTAKKSQYFLKGSTDTARGDYMQVVNAKGEKIYKMQATDNNGQEYIKILTESEYNKLNDQEKKFVQPVIGWTGSYMEGIVQSYVNLVSQLYKGLKELKNGNSDILKEVWNQYGKEGHIRHSNILQSLWDLLISTLFINLLYGIFFDDPEETGVSYQRQAKSKSGATQYFLNVVTGAARDANIINTLQQGLFNWEIPAISILGNVVDNFTSAFTNDDFDLWQKIWNASRQSFGIFKFLPR